MDASATFTCAALPPGLGILARRIAIAPAPLAGADADTHDIRLTKQQTLSDLIGSDRKMRISPFEFWEPLPRDDFTDYVHNSWGYMPKLCGSR